jgi:hypothetical protein
MKELRGRFTDAANSLLKIEWKHFALRAIEHMA